jgi:hypothetical protein
MLAPRVARGLLPRMAFRVGNLEMIKVPLHVEWLEVIHITLTGPLGKKRQRPVVLVDGLIRTSRTGPALEL